MASLGHLAVGMLAGRAFTRDTGARPQIPMLVFAGLAVLPDVDYVGVMLGIADAGPCGHRGATHSLIFALVVAALAGAVAARMRLAHWRWALFSGLAVASHALLDAMTVGSRGVPLLWPFGFARFEMPWRPIPNAPCGFAYFSMAGLHVASIELLQFLPVILLALWPRSAGPAPALPPEARLAPLGPGPVQAQMTRDAS